MPVTQANRLLSLMTPLDYDQLLIKRLSATEAISQLFQFELEILFDHEVETGPPHSIDPKKLIGQPMTVRVAQRDGESEVERFFNGICVSFVQGSRNTRWTEYRASLVPQAWLLTQRHQSRIFQQISVFDVLRKVLEGLKVTWKLQGTYKPRNYCVQYRESDWDFASRLMEEEGIFYFFEHTEDGHTLIVADTPQGHVDLPGKKKIPFIIDRSSISDNWEGSIDTWNIDDRLRTGKYTVWDHNFELVGKKLEKSQESRFDIGSNKKFEFYDYPGDYAKRFDGIDPTGGERAGDLQKIFQDNERTVKIRQQEIDVEYQNFFGTSDCCALTPGFKFEFSDHPLTAYNGNYILISVKTEAEQTPWYISDEQIEGAFQMSFVALSHGGTNSPPFRPLRKTPKPTVFGSQTAVVTGPSGEEIFTDKYGRVKVQFHWDREGQYDATSSCWLRVAQMWAGKQWGTMFIPRIGMEVLVDFLDGDPDKPIIVGCVYNPENMPPYTLPDEKTKSTIKSNSSKGSGGFNEIRIEDKKGSEQIFIHGEKDQDIRIKNDCKELITHDRHLIINNDQYEKVKTDKHLQVGGDHNEKIGGTMSLTVGSNLQEKVGQNYALDAAQQVHIKAGMTVVVEAGTSLTLKVGGNFININPGGIFVKGTMVMLNSGGAAGSGSGSNPTAPKDPKEADNADPGQNTRVPPAPAPPAPLSYGPLAGIMKQAAASGAPFCEL